MWRWITLLAVLALVALVLQSFWHSLIIAIFAGPILIVYSVCRALGR